MAISTALRALLLLGLLLSSLPASPIKAQTSGRQTFRDFGYGDLTARTMFGSLDYFFPVPRAQVPQASSQLELVVSHSPLLVSDRSTLTVVANGQSVTSVLLTPENRSRARIVVPLPTEGFSGNGYYVQIQFALRLTRD
ncbi:MAG: cellulose biosynthesis cyclic di-GMP-binding regulatory protein BcsB, partial [Chloroflexi bacterium]|nr:cellulose biosynthesis cyclic di-GMP-binding regulatory protein BcsB [Chloroflexota bacterium]